MENRHGEGMQNRYTRRNLDKAVKVCIENQAKKQEDLRYHGDVRRDLATGERTDLATNIKYSQAKL